MSCLEKLAYLPACIGRELLSTTVDNAHERPEAVVCGMLIGFLFGEPGDRVANDFGLGLATSRGEALERRFCRNIQSYGRHVLLPHAVYYRYCTTDALMSATRRWPAPRS